MARNEYTLALSPQPEAPARLQRQSFARDPQLRGTGGVFLDA